MYTPSLLSFVLAASLFVGAEPTHAAPLPLAVDALIDGRLDLCFNANGLSIDLGSNPYRYRWTCGAEVVPRQCYRLVVPGPVAFAYYVGDYYIALTCSAQNPNEAGEPPAPAPGVFFADGFEPLASPR